jgi:hypothetical protein
VIHAALVSAYPTETEARLAFTPPVDAPYLGVWIAPMPSRPACHVFSDDVTTEQLTAAQWTQENVHA